MRGRQARTWRSCSSTSRRTRASISSMVSPGADDVTDWWSISKPDCESSVPVPSSAISHVPLPSCPCGEPLEGPADERLSVGDAVFPPCSCFCSCIW